jgi:hypothetical protein
MVLECRAAEWGGGCRCNSSAQLADPTLGRGEDW